MRGSRNDRDELEESDRTIAEEDDLKVSLGLENDKVELKTYPEEQRVFHQSLDRFEEETREGQGSTLRQTALHPHELAKVAR